MSVWAVTSMGGGSLATTLQVDYSIDSFIGRLLIGILFY